MVKRRALFVIAPSDDLIDLMDVHDIPFLLFLDPVSAMDTLSRMGPDHEPRPILAYGERLFGPATTGQPARIAHDGPQIVLVETVDASKSGRMETSLVWHAASALHAWSVVDLSYEGSRNALRQALNGEDVEGITHKRGKVVEAS